MTNLDLALQPSAGVRRSIRVTTSLPLSDAIERLRGVVCRRPSIEGRRHWLTERCVTGVVDDANVRLDVKYRYVGRIYVRNTWAVRFAGTLRGNAGGTVLEGTTHYRVPEAEGAIRFLRIIALVFALLAIVAGVEGLVSGRLDYLLASLLAIPAGLLFVGAPRLEEFLERRAVEDAAILSRFLETALSSKPAA